MNGHKTPDCQGKWIDITTLSDPPPGKELCPDCRAIRISRPDEDLAMTIPDQDHETDEDEDAAFRRYMRDANREVQGSRIFLSYLAVFFSGVACGILVAWWVVH